MKKICIAALLAAVGVPAIAQTAEEPMALPLEQRSEGNAFLPANTEILLRMNQEVTTKGKTWSEDDTFNLTVVDDVMLGDFVVIPRGSKAVGRITWLTNKGMFGKSGKMDIELEHVEVSGRNILLDGSYRQEGEGNTLATVGGVILAGPFAAFITGKSGRVPQGRELVATTEGNVVLAIPASAVRMEPTGVAPLAGDGDAAADAVEAAVSAAPADGSAEAEAALIVPEAVDAQEDGQAAEVVAEGDLITE